MSIVIIMAVYIIGLIDIIREKKPAQVRPAG